MLKFEVLTTQWGADDEVFAGGVNKVISPSAGLLKLLAGAEAAGVVTILEASDAERAKMEKSVQSQEDGEAAYEAAQASGDWQEGNLLQFELDVEAGTRSEEIPAPEEVAE